jgi:VanZ family protein
MLLLVLWIFASATELAQGRIGRDPSLGDWAADMAGGVGGLLGGGFLLRALVGSRLPASVPVADAGPRRRAARR